MAGPEKICHASPKSESGRRALEYCLNVDDGTSTPEIDHALMVLDSVIALDDITGMEHAAQKVHTTYMALYANEKAGLHTLTKILETAKDASFGIAGFGAFTAGAIGLTLAAPYIIAGGASLAIRAMPLILPILAIAQRTAAPVQNIVYGANPALQGLHRSGILSEPNIASLSNLVTMIYGGMSLGNVIAHAGDEMGAAPATLPGEELFGVNARPLLGSYGATSIIFLLGKNLFALNPDALLILAAGHIASDFVVQNNSNGVEFEDVDFARVQGGATSAVLMAGGMNMVWNGFTVAGANWIGFANNPWGLTDGQSVAAYITGTSVVSSALFVPIALFLEHANLENFVFGLTAREVTVSLPRKIAQAILNTNSSAGMLAYTVFKVVENDFISRRTSFFEGSGLYRSSMHEFLSQRTSADRFVKHCLSTLASLRIFPEDGSHTFSGGDFELISKDIPAGLLSQEEITQIAGYVDEILTHNDASEARAVGLAWLIVFNSLKEADRNPTIKKVLSKYRAELARLGELDDLEVATERLTKR